MKKCRAQGTLAKVSIDLNYIPIGYRGPTSTMQCVLTSAFKILKLDSILLTIDNIHRIENDDLKAGCFSFHMVIVLFP